MKNMIVLLSIIFLGACDQSTESLNQVELPEPQIVAFSELPQSSAATYFLIGKFNEYESNLRRAILSGVDVQEAWIPLSTSPCECITCTEAMQIRVIGTTEQLDELGFVQQTDPWQINCGVQDFAHYDFTETE